MVTLVVEDGSNVADSNTYVDVAYADTIAELQNNFKWIDCPVEKKNKHLVNATNLIEMLYGPRYKGSILTSSQSLLFPRTAFHDSNGRVVDQNTIPKELKNAVVQAAFGFAEDTLTVIEEDFEDSNIKRESFSVGSGAYQESVEYFEKQNEQSPAKARIIVEMRSIINMPTMQFQVARG